MRWDSAISRDNGASWATDWIMEFTRTRPMGEVTQERLFDVAWTTGTVTPHAAARTMDWLIGDWEGVRTNVESGEQLEARLRCKLLNKGCLVLDRLKTRQPGATAWQERLTIRGYLPRSKAWEAWSLTEDDTRLRKWVGSPSDGIAVFQRTNPSSGERWIETWRHLEDGSVVLEEEKITAGAIEGTLTHVTELHSNDV